jgi:hypothetical protein
MSHVQWVCRVCDWFEGVAVDVASVCGGASLKSLDKA